MQLLSKKRTSRGTLRGNYAQYPSVIRNLDGYPITEIRKKLVRVIALQQLAFLPSSGKEQMTSRGRVESTNVCVVRNCT